METSPVTCRTLEEFYHIDGHTFEKQYHKVILKIRRRRWTDLRTGKSFSIPIDLDVVAKGTRYSKEFGAFLKETYGDIPSDLPYA